MALIQLDAPQEGRVGGRARARAGDRIPTPTPTRAPTRARARPFPEPPLALYVHIPFCVRKCFYCDFNSGPSQPEQREAYVDLLSREIRQSPWAGSPARTVFFGGGTPSELTPVQLARINEQLRETFRVEAEAEWTIEANPGTVTGSSLAEIRQSGFNRISLGVQTFHDHHLRAIGRIHTAAEARQAFRWAGEAGFASRNLDLIFGLPEQTVAEWGADLEEVVALAPEHISLYGLIIEEKTEFGRRHAAGRLPLPDEDAAADMYEMTLDRLAAAGYAQYEISNFARPGHECRHNIVYWRNEPYLGFGISAASFIEGERWSNTASLRIYRERIAAGASATEPGERLEGRAAAGEALMLALRMNAGADLQELSARYANDLRSLFRAELQRFVNLGLLEWTGEGRLRLTRRGLLLSNNVFAELV